MSQENSMYSYPKQAIMSFFFLSQVENRRTEQVLPGWGVDTCGRGEDVEKWCRRVKIVQILCTQVHKCKNHTC
jgi:hypothetical protein